MSINRQELRRGTKRLALKIINTYKIHYRKKDWLEFASQNTKNTWLSDEQKQKVDEFYKPYGKKIHYVFHAFYLEKTGIFSEKLLPEDFYFSYVDPYFNNWDRAKTFDNKCFYPLYFSGINMPETVGKRINGLWFDSNMSLLTPKQIYSRATSENAIFIKAATESYGGHGVFYYEKNDGDKKFLDIVSQIDGDVVLQKPIIQHDRLMRLNPSSVNSTRVISLLSSNGVKVYSCVLRMGINGAKVDNSSSGGICCGINNDGTLKKYGYTGNGLAMDCHPDTKQKFEGYVIPGYQAIIAAIQKLHCQIPHFRLISWDFSVDKDCNPILIEANLSCGGIKVHQLTNGPIFGDDTTAILNEVFGI